MYFRGHKIFKAGSYPAIYIDGKIKRIHIIVMEEKLGRALKNGEVVHHINEDKNDYSIENLICFASNSDHTAYHKGDDIYFDDEGIAHTKIKSFTKSKKAGRYVSCPICGKDKTPVAKYCKNCYKRKTKIPTIEVLENDFINLKTETAIAKKYNVSITTIRKWLKKYNLCHKANIDIPKREDLINILNNNNFKDTAAFYNISTDTLSRWIKIMNIQIEDEKIICVETSEIFKSALSIKIKYPHMKPKTVANCISKVLDKDKTFDNKHWKRIHKKVS